MATEFESGQRWCELKSDRKTIPDTLALVTRPYGKLYWALKPDLTIFGPFYTEQEADAAVMKAVEMDGVVDV